MQELNGKAIAVAVIAALAFVAAGRAQLEPMIGVQAANVVTSAAGFGAGLIGAVLAPFLGNSSMVKDASAINGARVVVSQEASPQIAALAMDKDLKYISPEHGQEAAVAEIAKGA
jgi:hypothetical protein